MKRTWDLKPDLLQCMLEARIVPAPMNNLGTIIQTTSGLSLVTPFPGAINLSVATGGSAASSAPSVSGTAFPTSIYVTGKSGITSMTAGSISGNPALAGGVGGASGGLSVTIKVGSGADEAGGSVSTTPAMSRTNPAYGGAATPILAYIGQPGTSSGMTTAANGQSQTSAPVPSLPSMGIAIPGTPGGPSQGQPNQGPTNPMGPQLGAPRMMPGLGTSLIPTLPGGLGIDGSPSARPPGGY